MHEVEQAIKDKNLDKLTNLLVEEPSLIDLTDDEGVLMALLAAKTGDIDIVRYVVEYSRASMNIYDEKHRNILHYGVMSGNLCVCEYLVSRVGMSPLEGDKELETPYELAHRLGYHEIEEYFEDFVGCKLENMYKNPIRTGFFPDPSIVRVGNDYYMVNSSFVYYPCIPISHSTDLINWKIIGHAITNPDWCMLDGIEGGRGYWAPDISYHGGRFFITATYRLNDYGTVYRKQIVVSSDKPEGPYSKPAIIDEDGIDPSIFVDGDRCYMLLNRGARILELNWDCTRQISAAQLLFYGDNKRAPEGPHLLKKDGYYYLFQAEGGTGMGHMITVSRSRQLMGSYEPCPYNPIMRQKDEKAGIQRCGHGKPVMTPEGNWYMVYLCARRLEGTDGETFSILGRETALDPITWTADGWPVVNSLKGPSCLQRKPYDIPISRDSDTAFDESTLYNTYLTVRVPYKDGISVRNKQLIIKGSKYDLDSIEARNILVRRQDAFCFDAYCTMAIPKLIGGQDCGMTCYYDENTYIKFGLFGTKDGIYLGIVEKIGDEVRKHELVKLDEKGKISLFVETKGLKRSFGYRLDMDDTYTTLATLDNVYYLCDEGLKRGKRFTGAMVGMYAYAGSTTLEVVFDDFVYTAR